MSQKSVRQDAHSNHKTLHQLPSLRIHRNSYLCGKRWKQQKPSTDTLAANPDGTPFRTADGKLLFRPGGHGALIENLNEQAADVIFIKNIDNVVPDRLKGDTVRYKQLLAGVLVTEQKRVFEKLQDPTLSAEERARLARPLRVCGVVKNTGEPGGGPFLVREEDGSVSCQILESSQIADPALMQQATHFNPVDLVCATRDVDGKPYYLPDFVDIFVCCVRAGGVAWSEFYFWAR